ncbi:MAG: SLAC1 anion channel family protein [Burkholderiales bacterium]|nr:SLAC1 anion channel family protein [Burkholderiales bacterium]
MSVEHSRLEHFPIPLFASVMGLGGYTLATKAAGIPVLTLVMTVISSLALVLVGVTYLFKFIRYPNAVKHEFNHPVRHAFFPAMSIGLLIMAEVYFPLSPALSKFMWVLGAVMQLVFTLHILTTWMFHDKFDITMITPAWFIPVVGNVLVPVSGIHHAPVELLWFFLSYGLFFWLVLQTIVMYRVIFHAPIPAKLLPTLFIMIAPPAVSFIAYVKLTQGMENGIDHFAWFLYYVAIFMTAMLLYRVKKFIILQFALPWWAYSFPLAAITIASFMMAQAMHSSSMHAVFVVIAWVLFVLVSCVIALLVYKTIRAMFAGKICVPE